MKNNRALTILIATAIVLCLCAVSVGGYAIYHLVNNPTVQAGISKGQAALSAMMALREKIMEKYPSANVSIQLQNGSVLEITLENPADTSLLESGSDEKAKDIARFAIQNYSESGSVQAVKVSLMKKTKVGIFSTWKTISHGFLIEELR